MPSLDTFPTRYPDAFSTRYETWRAGTLRPAPAPTPFPRPAVPPEARTVKPAALTAREREVLRQVADGLANKEIALRLGISIKTVEKHREHLMSKLDIHNIAGLTRYALANGIVGQEPQAV